MIRYRVILTVFLLILVTACNQPAASSHSSSNDGMLIDSPPATLTVFAAASLTEAFTEIAKQYEATHAGTEVALNFAGSQELAQQPAQGAPADVFASADAAQMEAAVEAGRVLRVSPKSFASNRLVIIYPGENPGEL